MPRRLAYPRRSHPGRPTPSRRPGPLDNGQKAALCILAKEAYEVQGGESGTGQKFEEWRHEQQTAAIGCDSLRMATQLDYKPLLAHFLNLKGEPGQAFHIIRQEQTSDRDLALYKLAEALKKASLPEAYAQAICRSQAKCTLDRATPKQLWNITFTITNRANARKRKADAKANQPF